MTCPTCGKPADAKYHPFCTRRCADVDLARWLNESYTIPAEAVEDDTPLDDDDAPPRPH